MKKVGDAFYVHKSNLNELLSILSEQEQERVIATLRHADFSYAIIKYRKETISLIESIDWDTSNEPTVGTSYCFKKDGMVKTIKGGTKVYHHKWQFVSPDYKGFNIEESKERSKTILSIPNIEKMKKQIGNKNFWEALLKENNIPI